MKIVILTALHERPSVSEIFLLSIERIKQKADIFLFAAVSDKQNKDLCEKYDVAYKYTSNNPVGAKWNTGLSMLMYERFDHLCIMGSDDIAATEVFTILYDENKHKDHFGYNSAYFLSPEKSEAKKFTYKTQKLIGSCRFISRQALTQVAWQVRVIAERDFLHYKKYQAYYMSMRRAEYYKSLKFISIISEPQVRLWGNELDKGLDMSLEFTMVSEAYFGDAVKINNPLVTAIKTQNIWSYNHVQGEPSNVEDATGFMSEKEMEYLYAIGLKKEATLSPIL